MLQQAVRYNFILIKGTFKVHSDKGQTMSARLASVD
ncbi:hypothetical protein J2T11_003307 [Paenarthrobacter nicotinovorans]|nr:hypothetical protein [Paenarthrobacter nicotinovorans]